MGSKILILKVSSNLRQGIVLLHSDPFYPLTVHPLTITCLSFLIVVYSGAFLFSIDPQTIILSIVWPCENSSSFFFVIKILAFVFAAVSPRENSIPMHFIMDPVSVEFSLVCPFILAFSLDIIVNEIALI